jgi:hypothetical protein
MSEHSLASPEASVLEPPALGASVAEEHPVPDSLLSDRRTLWGDFGKLLFGNVLVIAIVLILMAIFLV